MCKHGHCLMFSWVWQYNGHFFKFVFLNGLGWIFAWTLHHVYIEHHLKNKTKKTMKIVFPSSLLNQLNVQVTYRAVVSVWKEQNILETASLLLPALRSAWKWRESWLSCKYSQPSTDQEKSLASISHSFPFFLSFFLFFFLLFLTSD